MKPGTGQMLKPRMKPGDMKPHEAGDRSNVAAERKLRERRGAVEGCGIITTAFGLSLQLALVAGLRS